MRIDVEAKITYSQYWMYRCSTKLHWSLMLSGFGADAELRRTKKLWSCQNSAVVGLAMVHVVIPRSSWKSVPEEYHQLDYRTHWSVYHLQIHVDGVDDVSWAAAGQLHTILKVLARELNLAALQTASLTWMSGFSTTGHTAFDNRGRMWITWQHSIHNVRYFQSLK